jgi:hypothetical protein
MAASLPQGVVYAVSKDRLNEKKRSQCGRPMGP